MIHLGWHTLVGLPVVVLGFYISGHGADLSTERGHTRWLGFGLLGGGAFVAISGACAAIGVGFLYPLHLIIDLPNGGAR